MSIPQPALGHHPITRMQRLFTGGLLGALSLGVAARSAEAQTPISVTVDGTVAGTPLQRVWSYYGYDEVNYTTSDSGKALLGTLAQVNSAKVNVRTHFLLNTGDGKADLKWGSTNVYTEDASGAPVYNWTLLDGIMDTITGVGARPFTEIAFMPQALSTHPTPYRNTGTYTLDGGCFYPPKDYTKWGTLIQSWATHVKGRYPDAESTWQWELWNEPNIDYWHGTFAEYAKLYDYTEAALHGVLPKAPLGGPAVTAPGAFMTQFLNHCATGTNAVTGKTGTRLDLVTFHAKGGVAIVNNHVQMNLGNQLVLHRDGFNQVAAVPSLKATPIVVTEADPDGCAACSAATTPADAYRNSSAYAAYEVATMKRSLELQDRVGVTLRGLVTWAFLFNDGKLFPGYRVLQAGGIDLPVLNAFKLLGALAGNRVPVVSSGALSLDDVLSKSVRQQPDVDALATVNGRSIQVLLWNYHDDLVDAAASPVSVNVKVPASFGSSVTLKHLRADDTHGDAYTVWVAQGKPASPTAAQLQALKDGMQPTLVEPARAVPVTSGTVNVAFDLPRFGISLLTLSAADAGNGGAGGSGGNGSAGNGGTGNGGTGGTPDGALAGSSGNPAGGAAAGAVNGAAGASGGTGGATLSTGGAGGVAVQAGTQGQGAGAPASDSGCSCSTPRRSRATLGTWYAVLFLAFVAQRRASRRRRDEAAG